jgi:hypothetical protein
MRNRSALTIALGLTLVLAVAAAVSAHEGDDTAKLEVEPSEVPAGASVILVGSGLEPDGERVLVLAGGNLIVEFGAVATDAEGCSRRNSSSRATFRPAPTSCGRSATKH